MDNTFESLKISEALIQGLKKENIHTPTPIQAGVIPLALANRDILGRSATGSGKTLAYLLPVFMKADPSRREAQALILAPTHELVMQIHRQIQSLAAASGIPLNSAVLMGGVNIRRQVEKLKEKPQILVGSPGRILELIKLRKINAQTLKTLVIDEGDRLLDAQNDEAVRAVIRSTQRDRQLMLFSATLGPHAEAAARELMKDPAVVLIEGLTSGGTITHYFVRSEQREKIETLRSLLAAVKPKRALVFLNRSDLIRIAHAKLNHHHIPTGAIYGEAGKEDRKRALEDFTQGRTTVLIASELAARGLDIRNLTHIVNMDQPESAEHYLHRAGRTGRAGASGTVISIVTPFEEEQLKRIERSLGLTVQVRELHYGKLTAPRPPHGRRPAVISPKAPRRSSAAPVTPKPQRRS